MALPAACSLLVRLFALIAALALCRHSSPTRQRIRHPPACGKVRPACLALLIAGCSTDSVLRKLCKRQDMALVAAALRRHRWAPCAATLLAVACTPPCIRLLSSLPMLCHLTLGRLSGRSFPVWPSDLRCPPLRSLLLVSPLGSCACMQASKARRTSPATRLEAKRASGFAL